MTTSIGVYPGRAATGSTSPFNNQHDFLLINDWARHTAWLHAVMRIYAVDGVALFALLLVGGWWLARRECSPRAMAVAVWAAVGTIAAVGINQPIVRAVNERRPYLALHHTLLLVARSTDASFPSDHATMAGAVAAGLLLLAWRSIGWISAIAALLLAFARVYVGAHYPGDVLVGLALGAAVIVVGYLLVVPLLARLLSRAFATPLRPLLASRVPTGRTVNHDAAPS